MKQGVKVNTNTMEVTETDKGILKLQVVLDTLEEQEKSLTSRVNKYIPSLNNS